MAVRAQNWTRDESRVAGWLAACCLQLPASSLRSFVASSNRAVRGKRCDTANGEVGGAPVRVRRLNVFVMWCVFEVVDCVNLNSSRLRYGSCVRCGECAVDWRSAFSGDSRPRKSPLKPEA